MRCSLRSRYWKRSSAQARKRWQGARTESHGCRAKRRGRCATIPVAWKRARTGFIAPCARPTWVRLLATIPARVPGETSVFPTPLPAGRCPPLTPARTGAVSVIRIGQSGPPEIAGYRTSGDRRPFMSGRRIPVLDVQVLIPRLRRMSPLREVGRELERVALKRMSLPEILAPDFLNPRSASRLELSGARLRVQGPRSIDLAHAFWERSRSARGSSRPPTHPGVVLLCPALEAHRC